LFIYDGSNCLFASHNLRILALWASLPTSRHPTRFQTGGVAKASRPASSQQ
jgi:hypothetical protein